LFDHGRLKVVNICGYTGLLDEIENSMENDFASLPLSNSAIGTLLSKGISVAVNDISANMEIAKRKNIFLKHGIKSAIVFPLKRMGQTIGVFGFHSEIENSFDEAEINLLEEAASDISFALENIEKEKLHREVEKIIEQSEAKLNEAQAIAQIGNWEVDLINHVDQWSEGLFKILGIEKEGRVPSTELFMSFIHPEDVSHVLSEIQKINSTCTDGGYEFRFIRKDGQVRYGSILSRVQLNKNKKSLFAIWDCERRMWPCVMRLKWWLRSEG